MSCQTSLQEVILVKNVGLVFGLSPPRLLVAPNGSSVGQSFFLMIVSLVNGVLVFPFFRLIGHANFGVILVPGLIFGQSERTVRLRRLASVVLGDQVNGLFARQGSLSHVPGFGLLCFILSFVLLFSLLILASLGGLFRLNNALSDRTFVSSFCSLVCQGSAFFQFLSEALVVWILTLVVLWPGPSSLSSFLT